MPEAIVAIVFLYLLFKYVVPLAVPDYDERPMCDRIGHLFPTWYSGQSGERACSRCGKTVATINANRGKGE